MICVAVIYVQGFPYFYGLYKLHGLELIMAEEYLNLFANRDISSYR